MSFQAYLDNIEQKTGKTPREFIEMAAALGYHRPETKATEILAWLKAEFDLGRGHGMAIVHILKHGETISDTHVGTQTAHSDPTNKLDLEGKRSKLSVRQS